MTSPDALVLDYRVVLSEDGSSLLIRAAFPRGTPTNWGVDPPARPFLGSVQLLPQRRLESSCDAISTEFGDEGRVSTHEPSADFHNPEVERTCQREGCVFEYRFALKAAADALASRRVALHGEGLVVSPSSSWLIRPRHAPPGSRYRFCVHVPKTHSFVTGVGHSKSGEGVYEALLPDGYYAPYAAFGQFRVRTLEVAGAELALALLSAHPVPREEGYVDWVADAAQAVGEYFGRFPVERVAILLWPHSFFGSHMGLGGSSVLLGMDPDVAPATSGRAWVAAHELMHTAFVATSRRHRWASEGLSTYTESVARARAGQLSAFSLWKLFWEKLPLGQPAPADRGLNHTNSWASTYWGGAAFWFVSDVAALRATEGRMGLSEVFAKLFERGANAYHYWPIRRLMAEADEILGAPVFVTLYEQHALRRQRFPLDGTFGSLGVVISRGELVLQEDVPGAWIRHRIDRGDGRSFGDASQEP